MHHLLTLYADSSHGARKLWSICIEPDGVTITVQWGLVGGKLQQSSDTCKANAFKDAFEVCADSYARQVREKREEGYREDGEATDDTDVLTHLTKLFVPAKPIADMDLDHLLSLDALDKLYIQRKRDGQRHICLITRIGQVRLYSRRMDDMTDRFPKLVAEIASVGLPAGTILDGEIIVDRGGTDDFRAVGTVARASAKKAALNEATLPIRYMVFDVLWYRGQAVWSQPYEERYRLLMCMLTVDGIVHRPKLLGGHSKCLRDTGLAHWVKVAKAKNWEGLVVWFRDQPTLVRTGGKPKRTGCAKWKPKQERDFVATGFYLGSGNMSTVVGGLNIGEYLADGSFRSCGNVGGFKGSARIRTDALSWKYPCVVSVEYDKQEPEGKLRFPVVAKLHEDKTPDECIGPDRILEDDE